MCMIPFVPGILVSLTESYFIFWEVSTLPAPRRQMLRSKCKIADSLLILVILYPSLYFIYQKIYFLFPNKEQKGEKHSSDIRFRFSKQARVFRIAHELICKSLRSIMYVFRNYSTS